MCLPILFESDIAFQFVLTADTIEEANALCQIGESGIQIGLVTACDQPDFDVEFTEQPERFRISDLQVLYNWTHGLPGSLGFYDISECFYIRIITADFQYCSNCLQRIDNGCFSSVIEYGNDENAFGFSYCNGESPIDENLSCAPTIIEFINKETLTIPYTAALAAMYGDIPTVQTWIYDGTELVNMRIRVEFDQMPPTQINFDFGGLASGRIVIR